MNSQGRINFFAHTDISVKLTVVIGTHILEILQNKEHTSQSTGGHSVDLDYLGTIFVACLIVGIISVVVGFNNFSEPFKAKKFFLIGGVSFLAPVISFLILYTINEIKSPGSVDIPYGWFLFEMLIIFVLLFLFFDIPDEGSRNKTLGCSIFLCAQLILIIGILSTIIAFKERPGILGSETRADEYQYMEEAGQITITAYWGESKSPVIPSTIDGKCVTKIAQHAFLKNFAITDVLLPESITTIDREAFYTCLNLESITIPDSVTSIGENPFFYCFALTEINVSSENPNYSSETGILFNKDKTTVISCPQGKSGTVLLPDGVTNINRNAFYFCKSLQTITIPDSVTSIGNEAFADCSSLTMITIPASVTSIGDQAFEHCDNLVIQCRENSYAHSYAVENKIKYVFEG